MSDAKIEKLKNIWETKENEHTPRKLLDLLGSAVHVKVEEDSKNRLDTRKSMQKQRKAVISSSTRCLDEEVRFIPDSVLEDMHQAMEILRKENAHKESRFVNVDTLHPFKEKEPVKRPLKQSIDKGENQQAHVEKEKLIVEKEAPKSTSIIQQWKLAHAPVSILSATTAEPESLARSARWAQSCTSADTEALQKEFPPEEFTDLIDPVGFGETNPHPPVFRAVPSKTAKLVPVHRMSKANRQGVLNRESQPVENFNTE